MANMPVVKLGIVGVSRDCFAISLTRKRLTRLMSAVRKRGINAERCAVVIETENDVLKTLADLSRKGCNAAVVYLGNFGPEGPTTMFVERFGGPVMLCAAAEESAAVLAGDRGDALCGMLNVSFNMALRRLHAYVPQIPVGLASRLADEIARFVPIARVVIGVQNVKIFGFGPRPQDFLACNAPIQPLFDLGVEVMENSELDLLAAFKQAASKKREIRAVAADMKRELGPGCPYPDLLDKLAQLEVALLDFLSRNLGASLYGVFANKCWPAFEEFFGFVPCYVNSRLAGQGFPVACEVDMYGALSEYMAQLASSAPVTILDVNNSVPDDIVPAGADLKGAAPGDLFMGFHCGNTFSGCMKTCSMKYQLIMNRLIEGGRKPDITRGTLEGRLRDGPVTCFRLQASGDGDFLSYVAEGEVLDIDPCSFGSIGVIAIPHFARFYRHVLIGRHFPHHTALGFKKIGPVLFEALNLLGVQDISTPLAPGVLYEGENPFPW
ncbi:MAG: fucose isomerase [Planctomycetes bacterium]|nr:fucose isomerase [Planctomycetota bacterium]